MACGFTPFGQVTVPKPWTRTCSLARHGVLEVDVVHGDRLEGAAEPADDLPLAIRGTARVPHRCVLLVADRRRAPRAFEPVSMYDMASRTPCL